MPYYTEQQIEQARSIDLLTYLQTYEPTDMVMWGTPENTRRSTADGFPRWHGAKSRKISCPRAMERMISKNQRNISTVIPAQL